MKRLRVRDRVMTSQDACTSGTSRVLTVASLQRLKIITLIPAPADCEVRSVIKFLNVQSMAPIEIHRQLCQVYGHTRLDDQHIPCRSSTGRCFNHHPPYSPDISASYFHLFLHLKLFQSGQRQRFQNDREAEMSVTVVPTPGGRFLRHSLRKLVPQYDKCLNSGGEYVEK